MTCGSCSDKVKASLKGLEGVILAAVDYQTGAVEIAFDNKKIDVKTLEKTLVDSGYKLVESLPNHPRKSQQNIDLLQFFFTLNKS